MVGTQIDGAVFFLVIIKPQQRQSVIVHWSFDIPTFQIKTK
jgi:hypothetical protein